MDAVELVNKLTEFLEEYYKDELFQAVKSDNHVLVIDFNELIRFNVDISELLIQDPEEVLKSFELALNYIDLPKEIKLKIRINNTPKSIETRIRDIRSKHINKLISIEGIVKQKSDVRPQVINARFQCPSCGRIIQVYQFDKKFREPTSCSCGRKGKFNLLSKEFVDAQSLVLEETAEILEGGEQPKRITVFLQDDLVSPITERKTTPGSRVKVIGTVKEVPITLHTGGKSTRYDLMVEALYVQPLEEDYTEIKIDDQEKEEILRLANEPNILEKLVNSIAPSIYGHEEIKKALVLQLFGGVRKTRTDGVITRGDIHILLIGDPGAGKSQLLKRINAVAPKSRYVSGKGASGAGLTASVVKDEFIKGWSLEAGALVLANNGICTIDELDKMSKEDQSAMHEALEQQTITISKANIQATLLARTSVLAAANPKLGRFDPYDPLAKQIDLPPTLINRFDLIFPIKDMPSKEKDKNTARFILRLHQNPKIDEPEIPTTLLKKYISYARQTCNPILSDEAIEEIEDYYVKMRNSDDNEEGIKAIPITARQLEALVRLSEASAKTRLSEKVTREDARVAIDLLNFCLKQVGMDPETGKIDIDRITSGITASKRNRFVIIKEIIDFLEEQNGKANARIDQILELAQEKGISDNEVEQILQELKRHGDIYEPRSGVFGRIE